MAVHPFPETALGTRGFTASSQGAPFPHRSPPMILPSMILPSPQTRTCQEDPRTWRNGRIIEGRIIWLMRCGTQFAAESAAEPSFLGVVPEEACS